RSPSPSTLIRRFSRDEFCGFAEKVDSAPAGPEHGMTHNLLGGATPYVRICALICSTGEQRCPTVLMQRRRFCCSARRPTMSPGSAYANSERLGFVLVERAIRGSKPNTEQLKQGRTRAEMRVLVRVVEARGVHSPHPQAKLCAAPRRRCD